MTKLKNISDEDILFSRYLVELHIKTVENTFAEDPPRHPRLLHMLEYDLAELKKEHERLDAEIKRRNIEHLDVWTGLEPVVYEEPEEVDENGG